MLRKLFIVIFSSAICSLSLKGQQNLPLKFQEESPVKWSELSWINSNAESDQDFENRLVPVIIKDTIYTIENYIGKSSTGINLSFAGYLIKKLNIITGEKYWEVARTYKNGLKRKAISNINIKKDSIFVTLFDEAKSSGSNWLSSYPAYIVIDNDSGIVIDSNFVDRSDTTLQTFQTISGKYEEDARYYLIDDGFLQRSLAVWFFPKLEFGLVDNYLDLEGKIVRTDTATSLSFPYYLRDFLFFEDKQNGLNAILSSESEKWKNKSFRFLSYSDKLELLADNDITKYFTDSIQYFGLSNRTDGYFILGTQFEDFNRKEYEFNYHLFNSNGEFLDKLKFILRDGVDNGIKYGWIYPIVDKVNQRILLTRSKQDKINESTYFELFVSDGDSIQRIKRIEVEGLEDHFRTQYGTVLDNGDILLYVVQFASSNSNGTWRSWLLLDGQKMNIISDTKDIELVANKLKLFPNPTSGIVKINNLELPAIAHISSLNGQMLKQITVIENEVNISDMPPGLYIIEVRNSELVERHKILKVE